MLVNGSMGKFLRFTEPVIYGTPKDTDGAGAAAAGTGVVEAAAG